MSRERLHLQGAKELDRKLRKLGDRVHRKVSRQAVNAAATPVVRSARAKAPSESGTLKKSLGKKVVTYKKSATVAAIVGARKSVTGTHKGETRKPSRYAHLVEKGHINDQGEHVAAKPFLRPALEDTQGQAMDSMAKKFAEGVEREARRAS